jgi:pimeloyl-ACP methyl ester carboxylesterase
MEYIESAGTRIGFERRGDGPPLLLLHGLPGDNRIWRRQLDDLADEFTVVAWDAPGCGQSSDLDAPVDLHHLAQSLVAFIEMLDLDRPHVLGISWGSGVALELYRIAPTAPRSLVLASGYAGWAGSLPADVVAQRLDAYLTASRAPPQEALHSWAPTFFSRSAPADVVEELLAIASDFHPEAFSAFARSFANTDLRTMLPTITVPTLVLGSDADTRSPVAVSEALHAAIPGSRLVLLPGIGHVSNMEAPELFNAEVRRFLRSVPA